MTTRAVPRRAVAFVNDDGYRVEQIMMQRSLRRPARPYLRVTWRGRLIADCLSVEQVARHVDLASLRECWSRGPRALGPRR